MKQKQPSSPSRQSSWEQWFKELKAFNKTHGHCNVPSRYSLNSTLGSWVDRVRRAKKQGTLAEEKVCRLDALGFRWERQTPWKQRIKDLKAFKKAHGHCNVSHKYQPDLALGQWVPSP
ncbi:MAG: helicase associated domain-containing protein [Planctomycetota bacterium]